MHKTLSSSVKSISTTSKQFCHTDIHIDISRLKTHLFSMAHRHALVTA